MNFTFFVMILIDVSISMKSANRIGILRHAIQTQYEAIRHDPGISDAVTINTGTYSDLFSSTGFHPKGQLKIPDLSRLGPQTRTGTALQEMVKELVAEQTKIKNAGGTYHDQSYLVHITDGEPTGELTSAVTKFNDWWKRNGGHDAIQFENVVVDQADVAPLQALFPETDVTQVTSDQLLVLLRAIGKSAQQTMTGNKRPLRDVLAEELEIEQQ